MSGTNAETDLARSVPTIAQVSLVVAQSLNVDATSDRELDQVPTVMLRTENGEPEWRLGGEEVTKKACLRLFAMYFEKYHHFCPILDPTKPPEELHKKSPAPFWTVIGIAARQDREMPDLLARLKPSLEDMLQTMMFNNPTYVPHVQAMILWAVWPLPNLRSWNDKTLLVISAAVPHAMQLGLHRPGFEDEYSRMGFFVFRSGAWCDDPDEQEAVRRERTKTWLALIATYQSAYLEYGHLPMLCPSDRSTRPTVDQIRQADIAPELVYYQKLSNFMQYSMKDIDELGLVHQGNAEEFYMSMMKLERQMAAIEINIVNPSWMIALRLQSSKLYLRMMYFLDDEPSESRTRPC
ncbi:hypothetical protein INS49_010544 [Diaporthe citri]|uniref:uncharacterized protein n=1 Tax=Diaporthe citri TaxID=83186 RepID=UPI001C807FB7|nr:uncharacterized protein INS49_010544 [Diaporthe citri]KAG6362314.1 hypothetical protein INS49_010544 [Diaporthe citri]